MSDQKANGRAVEPKKPLPTALTFMNAGISGMCGTLCVHPMDVVKNRIQMNREPVSATKIIRSIMRHEGLLAFYDGLSAGLLRQAIYTSTRLGVYNQLQDSYLDYYAQKPTFVMLMVIAAVAGSLGAFIGTPADVALVRMSSDGRLPREQRRNYKSVLDAFYQISKKNGVKSLWRGSFATMGRATVVNVSQLTTYSQTKNAIIAKFHIPEGHALLYASFVSGIVTTINSMPFDIAKTRIQNLHASQSDSMLSIIVNIIEREGIRALWKGFWPNFCKIGSHTIIVLLCNEQLTKFCRIALVK